MRWPSYSTNIWTEGRRVVGRGGVCSFEFEWCDLGKKKPTLELAFWGSY